MSERGRGKSGRIAPLVEAEIVPAIFITGGAVEIDGTLVRVLGWSEFPVAGEISAERRLALRLMMTTETALTLYEQFGAQMNLLKRRGH